MWYVIQARISIYQIKYLSKWSYDQYHQYHTGHLSFLGRALIFIIVLHIVYEDVAISLLTACDQHMPFQSCRTVIQCRLWKRGHFVSAPIGQ